MSTAQLSFLKPRGTSRHASMPMRKTWRCVCSLKQSVTCCDLIAAAAVAIISGILPYILSQSEGWAIYSLSVASCCFCNCLYSASLIFFSARTAYLSAQTKVIFLDFTYLFDCCNIWHVYKEIKQPDDNRLNGHICLFVQPFEEYQAVWQSHFSPNCVSLSILYP